MDKEAINAAILAVEDAIAKLKEAVGAQTPEGGTPDQMAAMSQAPSKGAPGRDSSMSGFMS